MSNEKGVWRTIGGRRVFIKEGQDLASAMKESGKFKSAKKISKEDEDSIKESMQKVAEQYEEDKKEGKVAERLKENEINERKIRSEAENESKRMTKDDAYRQAAKELGYKRHTSDEKQSREIYERAQEIIKEHPEITEYENMKQDAWAQAAKELGYKRHNSDEKQVREINERYQEILKERDSKTSNKEQFSVGDLKKKAQATLPKEDIDTHEGDLYLKKTKESTELLNNMKDKDSGLLTTFKDQETGETWYDIPFANMGDDYKEKSSNDIMNEKIRSRGKTKVEDDLPKRTEIKTQGTSNRKEVSENIQAHILDYYSSDFTGEDIPATEAFVRQMDAMGEPNMWRAGQRIAEGGSYLIYNGDMADFLDELKINPKGKTFSEDKAFNMYTSLIGRESAKLYDRIQKNSYKKYMKAHPLSKMSFEEFKDMNKK